jgi:hypothetical protein
MLMSASLGPIREFDGGAAAILVHLVFIASAISS